MLHMVNHIQITMKFIYRAAIKIIFVFINLLNLVGFEEQPLHLQCQQCGTQVGARMGEIPCLMQPICKSPAALAEAESKS